LKEKICLGWLTKREILKRKIKKIHFPSNSKKKEMIFMENKKVELEDNMYIINLITGEEQKGKLVLEDSIIELASEVLVGILLERKKIEIESN
jgi:hypothetical protein